MLNCIENFIPGCAEGLRGLLQESRAPNGLGKAYRLWSALAVGPGDLFDHNGAAVAAVDAPHSIQHKDEESPEGNKLKTPFGELVVAAPV